MFILAGAVTMLLLHLDFVMLWESHYSHFPFKGQRDPIAAPPFFSTSARTLLITEIVLFILPLAVLWFAREGSFASTGGLFSGVMLTVVIIWLSTKQLREDSNMWPIDLVLLSIMTGVPLFLGCVTQIVFRSVLGHLRRFP